jgi:hypothetical protein
MKPSYELVVRGTSLRLKDDFIGMVNVTLIRAKSGLILFDTGGYPSRLGLLKSLRAGDAIKYAKEAVTRKCDMAFDAIETGTRTIERILDSADRIVPGHFPESMPMWRLFPRVPMSCRASRLEGIAQGSILR